MNQEHYERVRRVLVKSEAVMTEMVKKFGLREGSAKANGQCEKFWQRSSPKKMDMASGSSSILVPPIFLADCLQGMVSKVPHSTAQIFRMRSSTELDGISAI